MPCRQAANLSTTHGLHQQTQSLTNLHSTIFTQRKTQELPNCTDSFIHYLFLFALVQIMSCRVRHCGMLLHKLVSVVLFQSQAFCNLLRLTTLCAAFPPRWGDVEERAEQNISRSGFAKILGPRANLKNFCLFFSILALQTIRAFCALVSKRACCPLMQASISSIWMQFTPLLFSHQLSARSEWPCSKRLCSQEKATLSGACFMFILNEQKVYFEEQVQKTCVADYTEAWTAKLETHCTCCADQGHRTGKRRLLMQLWEHPNCHLVAFSAQVVGQKLKNNTNVLLILHLSSWWAITALKKANLKPTSSLRFTFLSWTLPFLWLEVSF